MTSPRTAVLFALLAFFITHQSFGEEPETRAQLEIGDAEIAFIEAREYDNSKLKQIRNSILYWIAPNHLKAVWPFDGYDVETVRNLACEPGSRYTDVSLGNKLTFVRAWGDHPVETPVDGVEVDFKRSPESGPRLGDLCNWLRSTTEDSSHSSITQIILQYDALNPPGEGRWELVNDKAEVSEQLGTAVPILEGKVSGYVPAGKPYRGWKQTESGAFLDWTALGAKEISADIPEDAKIWRYLTNAQDMSRAYFLTVANAEIENGQSQSWESLQSRFTWDSPPTFDDGVKSILWASQITQRHLDDDWYLVTDKGFADLDPARRFEQQFDRKGTIDTDIFISEHAGMN